MNSKYTGLQVEALLDKVQGQYTKEEINALIGNYEKKAWMGTSAQYNALEQIEEDRMYLITDGTAPDGSNIVDLTQYYTKDEINELLTGKANASHTHTLEDITDYTAPTYKTINGQSILGEGNITIEGGSDSVSIENFDRLEKTVSTVFYDYDTKIRDRYTKAISDAKYQPNGNYLTQKSLRPYYTSDYIDSKLRVISAALNDISDRIASLEVTNNK